jgi:rubrerythrin
MAIRFTADEVLQVAEQIERNGARFYAQAAERVPEAQGQELLRQLSEWELRHERIYAAMRAALPEEAREQVTYDPAGELPMYLRAMADRRIFDVYADPSERLGAETTDEQMFDIAVGVEKDSIIFYLGMRDLVPARYGTDRIDAIIREEMMHLSMLSEWMARGTVPR